MVGNPKTYCTKDTQAACGKCDRVLCDDDQNKQCQNGECNDNGEAEGNAKRESRCYDYRYWQIVMIVVMCSVFAIVVGVSILAEYKRRKDKRRQEMENA